MTNILAITFPIYAAIAIGYLTVRYGWFSKDDMRTYGQYVIKIALPALLFNAVASRDLNEVIVPGYLAVFALGGLAAISVSYFLLTLRGVDPLRRALGVMGSTSPNSGFVGYPIMLLALPDLAPVVLALNFLVENLLTIPICLILMEAASGKGQGSPLRQILTILGDVLKTPFIIGLLLGMAVSVSGIGLPEPLGRLAGLLAASASALSLVVIGGSLVDLPVSGNKALAVQITVQKLFLHPALMALAAFALTGAGLVQLEPDMMKAVILSAAMPMFGIYVVLAQKHGLEGAASLAMLGATSGAFVTLSLLLFWLF